MSSVNFCKDRNEESTQRCGAAPLRTLREIILSTADVFCHSFFSINIPTDSEEVFVNE